MKKLMIVVMALFLSVPLAAHAGPYLGIGDMKTYASDPEGGGYKLDYDGKITSSDFKYDPLNTLFEMFCVSSQSMNDATFKFYAIRPDMEVGNFTNLSMAAWVADNWVSFFGSNGYSQDSNKGQAQKAVWKLTGVMDITGGEGRDWNIYQEALGHSGYLSDTQLFAYSPSKVGDPDYQDFIVPGKVPPPPPSVPEPTTLLLLGLGLIGLSGVKRKVS
jgi:hypothetical protein